MKFEWDLRKEIENYRKHRVFFSEAVESFYDPSGIQLVDHKHSHTEARFYWVGKSLSGRTLTSWFTMREEIIRLIGSAEWRNMKRLYNEKTKNK